MRWLVVLAAVLLGCEYQTNYYGDEVVADAGVDAMPNVFVPGSKLQGNAQLLLQPSPVQPTTLIWPYVDPRGGAELLDVQTADGLPRVVTITLARIGGPLGLAGSPNSEAVAVCELGIGGIAFQNVEIDFIEGQSFSLAVTRIGLVGVYRELPGVVAAVGTNQIQVGASLSMGVVAHGRAPQRTLTSFAGLIAAVGNDFWRIPKFAKSFRVVARPNNSQLLIDLISVGGADAGSYNAVGFPTPDYPVPSDAHSLRVLNTGPNPVVSYSLIFELSL